MTRPSNILFLLFFPAFFFGCCSTRQQQREVSADSSGNVPLSVEAQSANPTVMKPNFIAITATIESLIVIDTIRFRLMVVLHSASSTEGMESLSAGERIELTPKYILADDSSINPNDARNKELLSIRSASAGEQISGVIMWNPTHHWLLLSAKKL